MKNPLRRLTIAVTGDFGKVRTHEKLKQWIEKNGGTFVRKISDNVTHLICSKEDYKDGAPLVLKAKRISSIAIVSYDWLEDSLMLRRPKPEAPYLMKPRRIEDVEKRAEKKKKRRQNVKKGMKRFERGCQEFKEVMGTDGYQIYRDHTTFLYDVTLVRANLLENKNKACHLKVRPPPLPSFFSTPIFPMPRPSHLYRARVHIINVRAQRLQLYESHSVPKYYACFVRYSEPEYGRFTNVIAPPGSCFEGAMNAFKMFFMLKTHILWEERLKSRGTDPEAYQYRPPVEGMAKGVVEDVISERDAVAVESVWRQVVGRELGMTSGEYPADRPALLEAAGLFGFGS